MKSFPNNSTPISLSAQNKQNKAPFYFPSPSNIRRIKSPIDFPKPSLVFSPNYSNTSNTKNSSLKEKMEKSPNSFGKQPEELIQNLEEKRNKALRENLELSRNLNCKIKDLDEEKKASFGLKAKIRELEGLLSLYTKEKLGFEAIIKEKDEEIDEIKEKLNEFKEKYLKMSYFELQLENYQEVIQELQRILAEKGKDLKMKDSFLIEMIDNEKLGFLNKIEGPQAKIKKILEKIKENEARNQEFLQIIEKNKSYEEAINELENEISQKTMEFKERLRDLEKKNKDLIDLLEKNKGKSIHEVQLKQLKEIDNRNKLEIEKLFSLLNARKSESDRLHEENKQIKEKYHSSLQKIKNLEHFFSQNFANS